MSTIVAKAGEIELPLVWWELVLPRDEDGQQMVVWYDNIDNPTEVRWTFYDTDDAVIPITQFAQVGQWTGGQDRVLYVLSRVRPTNDERWRVASEPIRIPAPWERVEYTVTERITDRVRPMSRLP